MNENQTIKETFFGLADEFFSVYMISSKINGYCYTSRLFIMGHALELYIKCILVDEYKLEYLLTHKIFKYVNEIDSNFSLSSNVINAGKSLFSEETNNFRLELFDKHREDLELYLIYYQSSRSSPVKL